MGQKCKHKDGDVTMMFGQSVDPCRYKVVEGYRNVTVIVAKCPVCGAIDFRWKKTADTEELFGDELEYEATH